MTPQDRILRAKLAVYTSWGNTEDRRARTAPARQAFEQRFLDLADGDPKRAEALRRAHFARMQLRSKQTRQAKKHSQGTTP